jgi:hypothetical protein
MTTRTRYFVIASLLILSVGVGTGLVAYYVGVPMLTRQDGPDELRYIPRDAAVVASVNVQEVMHSDVRERLHRALPMSENGQREFQNETGINIETDIDRIVVGLEPRQAGAGAQTSASPGGVPGGPGGGLAGPDSLILARGRFDTVKIEAAGREHGAEAASYNKVRVVVMQPPQPPASLQAPPPEKFVLAFMEPGLVALGNERLVHLAIDLKTGGENATANKELMTRIKALGNDNAWAVGRFDALGTRALPPQVASQLPAITWFSVSGRIDRDIRGVIAADTRDEEAANNFRDVLKGFMALAKMQAGSKPEFQAMMQSLQLGGTGKTVQLSFSVPGEVFDVIGGLRGNRGGSRGNAPTLPPSQPVH